MSFKKGRLSTEEKKSIEAKVGDVAALKRVAKKLNRSMDTVQKYVDSLKVEAAPEPIEEAKPVNPIGRPEVTDAWGDKQHKETGVVVATQATSDRVDKMNKKIKRNTVEQILESKPDCTARIR